MRIQTNRLKITSCFVDLQSLGESAGKASLELLQVYKQKEPGNDGFISELTKFPRV